MKGEPHLLFVDGEFRWDTMRTQRVPPSEVLAAIRAHGISDIRKVSAVVLETDGNFSVLPEPTPEGDHSALRDVAG